MKVIIAGSRSFQSYGNELVKIVADAVLASHFPITEVVSGHAYGVDRAGEEWANLYHIPVKLFIPDWNQFGKQAGMLRNIQMLKYSDSLIVLWNGESHGTKQIRDNAYKMEMPVFDVFSQSLQLSLF